MTTLQIRRIILYKHGVGYFERRGEVSGEALRLHFPRPAMDDVLKSLVALDLGAGQVLSIDFETPEDRAALLEKGSIRLSENRSLLDLLGDLRGRQVRCTLYEQQVRPDQPATLEGIIVGVDYEKEEMLKRAIVSIYQPQQRQVMAMPVLAIKHLELLDDTAAADLSYFLRATQSEEERRSATLHLSPGDHTLLVGYIAPAPSWRVSYRMLYESTEEQPATPETEQAANQEAASSTPSSIVLLQGWGLFDNQLEEDLENVNLTLVAGMPVSFRYRLYEPKTPERPLVEDEERTVSAPVFFESAPPPAPAPQFDKMSRAPRAATAAFDMAASDDMEAEEAASFSIGGMEESVQISASGDERGALFAYQVGHPVSVGRGQSAMVPILGQKLSCRRDLLYNSHKLPRHPVASLRLTNDTGLTLERGPVTVLEDGDYAGEAVIPFTRAGGEVIVPFAVELGISVEEKLGNERRMTSISVRDDYFLIEEYHIQHTTYHLTSTLSNAADVMIEHGTRPNFELFDTPEPVEESASFVRWNVQCAPHARTIFEVHERMLKTRHEQVRNISGRQLHEYMQNKLLDDATFQALHGLLQVYHQISQAQRRIKQVGREREAIYKQQKQIQGNLEPLGREGDEGTLRKRYVTELNRMEDQLQALAAEEQQLQEHVVFLEQQAQERLKELQGATGKGQQA